MLDQTGEFIDDLKTFPLWISPDFAVSERFSLHRVLSRAGASHAASLQTSVEHCQLPCPRLFVPRARERD